MLIPSIFQDFPSCRPKQGILHVGAHTCEEEPLYNSISMYGDNVLWIEANSDLVLSSRKNILSAVISDTDDEEVEFYITNNIQSSSILKLHTHLIEHPDVHEIEKRTVRTTTLNTLLPKHNIPYDRYDFMNLDIQGAELKALQGATELLPHIKAIYTEVNERELYKGCAFVNQLDEFLMKYNFKRVATQMTHNGWGDALYLKT